MIPSKTPNIAIATTTIGNVIIAAIKAKRVYIKPKIQP